MEAKEVVRFLQRLGILFDEVELKTIAEAAAKGINNAKVRLEVNNAIQRLKSDDTLANLTTATTSTSYKFPQVAYIIVL